MKLFKQNLRYVLHCQEMIMDTTFGTHDFPEFQYHSEIY